MTQQLQKRRSRQEEIADEVLGKGGIVDQLNEALLGFPSDARLKPRLKKVSSK